MNENKLKSVMVLNGDSVEELSQYLGISPQSLRKKIKEDGTCFRQNEIHRIISRYNLSPEETTSIFFA